MLAIYHSPQTLELEKLLVLPPQMLNCEWDGKQSDTNIGYILAKDPYSLFLAALWPEKFSQLNTAALNTTAKSAFVEGLWEKNVLELFLKEDGSSRYQEFHISPEGAWWSAVFSAPRVRETQTNHHFQAKTVVTIPPAKGIAWSGKALLCSSSAKAGGISCPTGGIQSPIKNDRLYNFGAKPVSVLQIPLSSVFVSTVFGETSRANVCACIGESERSYLSACPFPGASADFHQPESWGAFQTTS